MGDGEIHMRSQTSAFVRMVVSRNCLDIHSGACFSVDLINLFNLNRNSGHYVSYLIFSISDYVCVSGFKKANNYFLGELFFSYYS